MDEEEKETWKALQQPVIRGCNNCIHFVVPPVNQSSFNQSGIKECEIKGGLVCDVYNLSDNPYTQKLWEWDGCIGK